MFKQDTIPKLSNDITRGLHGELSKYKFSWTRLMNTIAWGDSVSWKYSKHPLVAKIGKRTSFKN